LPFVVVWVFRIRADDGVTDGLVGAVRSGLRLVAEVFYPRTCAVCGGQLDGRDGFLCPRCAAELAEAARKPYCHQCADDVGPHLTRGGRCARCAARRGRIGRIVRVCRYDGPMRRLIRSYKYHGCEYLDRTLAAMLASVIEQAGWADRIDGLVPIPMHWLHRLERGFHPVRRLARQMARQMGLPVWEVLGRRRGGRHQVGLPASRRRENIRGAFRMERGVRLNAARLCLVDDVRTTGATLDEAARVLLEAGAAEVVAAVLAKAAPPQPGQTGL